MSRLAVMTPEKQKEALLLQAQGLNIRDIAKQIGINKSSVGRFLKSKGEEQ